MITIEIPGHKKIESEHLVIDYNGTLAIDGKLIEGTKPILDFLSNHLTIHILTADTFGTSQKELSGLNCKLEKVEPDLQDIQKEKYVLNLGKDKVLAIGNGANDFLMLKHAALGIVVVQKEGASVKTLLHADIVCNTILDALDLLANPIRIVATLRN